MSTDTTVSWNGVKYGAGYFVRWRRTDSSNWANQTADVTCKPLLSSISHVQERVIPELRMACTAILKGIRVDDWVFGVSSVSKDGYESPVASAVPGGAFKPYVAPPPKP